MTSKFSVKCQTRLSVQELDYALNLLNEIYFTLQGKEIAERGLGLLISSTKILTETEQLQCYKLRNVLRKHNFGLVLNSVDKSILRNLLSKLYPFLNVALDLDILDQQTRRQIVKKRLPCAVLYSYLADGDFTGTNYCIVGSIPKEEFWQHLHGLGERTGLTLKDLQLIVSYRIGEPLVMVDD